MKKDALMAFVITGIVSLVIFCVELYAVDHYRMTAQTVFIKAGEIQARAENKTERLDQLQRSKANIEKTWQTLDNTIHRGTLKQKQLRPLYDIGVSSLNSEAGVEERMHEIAYHFSSNQAEFHRIVEAISTTENELLAMQFEKLTLTLPQNAEVYGETPTYLDFSGIFSMPAE